MVTGRFAALLAVLCLGIGTQVQGAPPAVLLTPEALEAVKTLKADRVRSASNQLLANRMDLGLGENPGFYLRSAHIDGFGQTHARFRQYSQGVPVWGGEVIVHLDPEGNALPVTDALYRDVQIKVTPSIGVSEVLAMARRDHLPAGSFTLAPALQLVVFPEQVSSFLPGANTALPNADDQVSPLIQYTLAYHLHIELTEFSTNQPRHLDLICNAHTGALLSSWDSLQTDAAEGTGKSQYSGTVKLSTATTSSGFEMRDLGRGGLRSDGTTGNLILNLNHATSGTGTPYTDPDNTWGDGHNYVSGSDTNADNGQTAAVDAAFGLQASWDYFSNVHGRNGIDDAGTPTSARVHFSSNYDNAFWSDSCFCITYGDGSRFTSMAALDVAGHELTHGVTAATAGLIYSGESGGLNESTSDIFGTMIEFHARGGSGPIIGNTGGNWTEGEQLSNPPLRYLHKPSLDGRSPDAWSSTIKSLDVHFSSGPMNRCFYFLSQGASSDSTTQTYSSYLPGGMAGIGNDKAAPLWYRALTTYLTPTSGYKEARQATLRAAVDLYGDSSPEFAAVQNAFAAINVGGPAGSSEDLQPPLVSASVTGTQGSITLSATATDNVGVSRVTFLVDGAQVGQVASAPFQLEFDSTSLSNGAHDLVAQAVDALGNLGTSAPVAFTLENNVSEYLLNPGFELGASGWTASPNVLVVGYPLRAHSGQGLAWFGGSSQALTETVWQDISLPGTMAGAQLRGWLYIQNAGSWGSPDTFKIRIYDSATKTELATLASFSSQDAGSGYSPFRFDMSSYAGKNIRLHFECHSMGSYITSFLLDDLSLRVARQDLDAPTVSATVAGSRGTLTLEALAQDDVSVTKVEFYVDGSLKATDSEEPYRTQLDSTALTNGAHTLVAKAFDASAKMGTSNSLDFVVDNQAPTVTVAVSGTKGTITLSATATDNLGIARLEFFVDGNPVGTSTAMPYQVTFDSTTQKNGGYTLLVKAYDAAGNSGQSSISFTVDNPDTTPPTLSASQYGNRGHISLNVSASDNVGVTKVEAYLDDKLVATRVSSYLYEYFDSTRITDGSHSFMAKAYDAAGNVGTINPITFTIDNTPPTIAMVAPTATSGAIQLSATATDNTGVTQVQFTVDGNWIPGGTMSAPPFAVTLDSTKLRNGSHTVRATAQDEAGNYATSSDFTFTTSNPDTTPPTLYSVNVSGSRGGIYFNAHPNDINGVSKVEFYVDDSRKGTYTSTYEYAYLYFDSATLTDGSHTLIVKAYDPSGNVGVSAPVTFQVDNTPPTVSVTGTLEGTSLTLTATAADTVGLNSVTFYLDGRYQGNVYASPYVLKLDATRLPNGSHTLTAVASDSAGNSATSAPVTLVLNTPDTTPPTIDAYLWGKKGNIQLSAYAYDLNGITKIEFHVDGVMTGSVVPNGNYAALNLDSTKLVDGTHALVVKAYDAAGNIGSAPSKDFLVDNTSPTQVAATVSGSSGTLTLSATATDNLGVSRIEFYVDGNYQGYATPPAFTLNFNSQYLKNGPHILVAKAYDAADNLAVSPEVAFTTNNPDTTAPYVHTSVWGSGTLNCTAYASDLNGVVKVEFFVDGQMKGAGTSSAADPSTFRYSLSTIGLSNGSHDLTAKATDAAGNVGTSYPNTFTVDNTDTTPPTITNVAVSGTLDIISLQASVTDNKQVSRVEFLVDGSMVGARTSAPYTFALNSTTLANGSHSLIVKAIDQAGNQADSPSHAFLVNNPDRTPPSVSVSVEGAAGSILLNAQAFDEAGIASVDFYVDDQFRGSDYEAPFVLSLASEVLANGTHTLVAKAVDTTGNVGESAPLSFLVDNTDTLPPVTSAWVNGSSGDIRLNAAASDNRGVLKVAFFVDGVLNGEVTTIPYALTIDSTTLTNGEHSLIAKAFDAAGNVGASQAMPFTLANIQVTVTPGSGVVRKGQNLSFTASLTGTENTAIQWSVVEPQGGSVTQSGVYTAPHSLGTYHLVAASVADPNAKTTITIRVVNPPDLNGDGAVSGIDIGILARTYSGSGIPAESLEADLDGDGDVDDDDLAALLAEFAK